MQTAAVLRLTPRARRVLLAVRSTAHAPAVRLAFFCACALFVTAPLFDTAHQLNEFRDAQVLQNYEMAAVKAVLEHGDIPLWNPYYCGGIYGLGTPQSRFASPPFLLSLAFGALGAPPLIAFFLSVLGMEGFFRFARTRSASALAPALIAPLWGAHGYMPWSYFNGWINFYGFLLLPWVLYGVDLAVRRDRRAPLVTGLAFAFIIGFGGTYAAPMGALLALAQAARALTERARGSRPLLGALLALSLAGYVAVCMSAFRLWPVLESLIAAPRVMAGTPEQPLSALATMSFEIAAPQGHNLTRAGQMFVGYAVLPLFAFGLVRARAVVPLALAALCVWCATGYAAQPSAFAALRELPLFSTLRYPQRFLVLASLFGFEAAALGLDRVVMLARRVFPPVVVLGVAIALVLASLHAQHEHAAASVQGMWLAPAPEKKSQPFKQARGNRWLAAHYPGIERGSLACWEAYPVPMSPLLTGDLAEEAYLADESAGRIERVSLRPGRIELHASLQKPARVLVNQNYHPGFRSSVGRVVSHDGLLAVDLPRGEHALSVRFRPRSALFGSAVSALALAAALAFLARRKRAMLMLLVAIPALAFASFVVSDEPLPQAAPLTNADGTPLVARALDPSATPLSVDFVAPVSLLGASGPEDVEGEPAARFSLYFRVHGPVPRSLGVHVRFESNLGRRLDLEHEVLGGSVFFADAPRGVLLRDVFYAPLEARAGETFDMYVSLRHVSGDESRVPVKAAHGTPVSADSVRALRF